MAEMLSTRPICARSPAGRATTRWSWPATRRCRRTSPAAWWPRPPRSRRRSRREPPDGKCACVFRSALARLLESLDEEGAPPVPRSCDLRRLRSHDPQGRAHRGVPGARGAIATACASCASCAPSTRAGSASPPTATRPPAGRRPQERRPLFGRRRRRRRGRSPLRHRGRGARDRSDAADPDRRTGPAGNGDAPAPRRAGVPTCRRRTRATSVRCPPTPR